MPTVKSEPTRSLYFPYRILPFESPPELAGRSPRHDVLIVGAGPVGLTLALLLERHGVRATVMERNVEVSEGSRAVCMTRRSMQILEMAGVASRITDLSLCWDSGTSFYRNNVVYEMRLPHGRDDRYLPLTNLQQNHIEQVLREQCCRRGIEIRNATGLCGIDQDDETVRARFTTPAGEYEARADWLVACDGARSTVRKLMGLRLQGTAYEGRFLIIDIKIDIDAPAGRRAYFSPDWLPEGTALFHKKPFGMWRLDYQLPRSMSDEQALCEKNVRNSVEAHLAFVGIDADWQLDWCSVYSANTLTLDSYHHDRVLFAGDAAHILPIFGVRGMNTGLQDAANLAWKLAAVRAGHDANRLLQSYSAERVEAARAICQAAGRSTRFMTPPSTGHRILRDAVLALSVDFDFPRKLIDWRTSGWHPYHNSPLSIGSFGTFEGGPVPGDLAPDARGLRADGSSGPFIFECLGRGANLLCFSPTAGQADKAAEHDAGPLPFNVVTIGGDEADVPDCDGTIAARYGAAPGCAYLLRPDQHIVARWSTAEPDGIDAALAGMMGAPSAAEPLYTPREAVS